MIVFVEIFRPTPLPFIPPSARKLQPQLEEKNIWNQPLNFVEYELIKVGQLEL